jgi:hypothetical protein
MGASQDIGKLRADGVPRKSFPDPKQLRRAWPVAPSRHFADCHLFTAAGKAKRICVAKIVRTSIILRQ